MLKDSLLFDSNKIKSIEDALSKKIREGKEPSLNFFIEHIEEHLDFIRQLIRQQKTSPFEFYIDRLKKFPAVFSTYLIYPIMEGYGEGGNSEVYPFIMKSIETHELSDSEKNPSGYSSYGHVFNWV